MRWDLFCHVIDNFGDVGVCWRLATDLAARGEQVRLWIDDATALAWMAPALTPGVEVRPWHVGSNFTEPGDVVVEAFGCELPAPLIEAMASCPVPPLWINLEYLSAEPYVERSHGLRSPQWQAGATHGAATGLDKWFFYPGFTSATGGLLREPGLIAAIDRFDRDAWLAGQGWSPAPGERVVSLFCYEQAPVATWCDLLSIEPTLLLVPPGPAQRAVGGWKAAQPPRQGLRVIELPWLAQRDYDRLLWACDLNFVRGEDSFVRAQWAAVPFIWQIYPQHDGIHARKLDAFLDRFLAASGAQPANDIRNLMHAWNGLAPRPQALPPALDWRRRCRAWREHLLLQDDLGSQLLAFCRARRPADC